jgi:ABC-type transport system involved in cytochrome c biogenesis ATPase subunit
MYHFSQRYLWILDEPASAGAARDDAYVKAVAMAVRREALAIRPSTRVTFNPGPTR